MATYTDVLDELLAKFPGETIRYENLQSYLEQLDSYQAMKNPHVHRAWERTHKEKNRLFLDARIFPAVITLGKPGESLGDIEKRHGEWLRQQRLRVSLSGNAYKAAYKEKSVEPLVSKANSLQEEVNKTREELVTLQVDMVNATFESSLAAKYQEARLLLERLQIVGRIYAAAEQAVVAAQNWHPEQNHTNAIAKFSNQNNNHRKKQKEAEENLAALGKRSARDPKLAPLRREIALVQKRLALQLENLTSINRELGKEVEITKERLLDQVIELDSLGI